MHKAKRREAQNDLLIIDEANIKLKMFYLSFFLGQGVGEGPWKKRWANLKS